MTAVPTEHLGIPGLRRRQQLVELLRQQLNKLNLNDIHTAASKYIDGFPARTPAAGEPGGGVHATSTLPVRLTDNGPAVDPTRATLTTIDRALERAQRALTEVLQAQAALVTVAPYQKQDDKVCPDGWCTIMWRVGVSAPMKGAGPTDVAGNLDEPVAMCDSVYNFVRTRGRLPTIDECKHFRDHTRWPKVYEKNKH